MDAPGTMAGLAGDPFAGPTTAPASAVLLDFFFPGMSMFTGALQRYLHVDLNLYFPLIVLLGGLTFAWRYFVRYLYDTFEAYCMCTVEVRYDDEVYNMLMTWVTYQPFARSARRFVVNTVVGTRDWSVRDREWQYRRHGDSDDDGSSSDESDNDLGGDGDGDSDDCGAVATDHASPDAALEARMRRRRRQKKPLSYTPSFGTYYFWFRGQPLVFRRRRGRDDTDSFSADQRESITLSCFGRRPAILKALLHETRRLYLRQDRSKTVIFRGSSSGPGYRAHEPTWLRCMARSPRPLSTVILDETTKSDLVADIAGYLKPVTRRWYVNRGIPYRRGYLLFGPPGTGKSSLSVSLAGHFNMNIYMVSLNGAAATEETLASLFISLPRHCIVLLEDIDTAGLTHTRDDIANNRAAIRADADDSSSSDSSSSSSDSDSDNSNGSRAGRRKRKTARSESGDGGGGGGGGGRRNRDKAGRLSLSGLLNILDGVASQEGRILIMTTNHVGKLDDALVRPGRVDMRIRFGRADRAMTAALFRSIFATLEGDLVEPRPSSVPATVATTVSGKTPLTAEQLQEQQAAREAEEAAAEALLQEQAAAFAAAIPERAFSPAELQGYLLMHKCDPDAAVAGAAAWVTERLADRAEAETRTERQETRRKARADKIKLKRQQRRQKRREKKREKAGRPVPAATTAAATTAAATTTTATAAAPTAKPATPAVSSVGDLSGPSSEATSATSPSPTATFASSNASDVDAADAGEGDKKQPAS